MSKHTTLWHCSAAQSSTDTFLLCWTTHRTINVKVKPYAIRWHMMQ